MFTITIMRNIVYLWRKHLLLSVLVLLTSLVHGNVEVVTSPDEFKAAMNNQEVDTISIESSTPFVVANGYLINRKLFIDGNNKAVLTFQPAVVGDVLFYDNETASGELTLSQITISDSKGQLLSFGATGGQNLTIFDCVFNNNTTDADSYLISYSGGEGLVNLQIDSTSFTANTTESVLYVQNFSANITIQDSEFSFNKLFGGSAIQCQYAQELLVSRVTFEANTTGGIGGAINLDYVGDCTISNSTLTANQAQDGAAIYVGESSYPNLEHLTILNNKVTGTGLVYPVHCLGSTAVKFSIINGIGGDSQVIYSYGYNLFDAHPGFEENPDDRIFLSEADLSLDYGDNGGFSKTFNSVNGNSIAVDVFDQTKLIDGKSVTEFDQNRNSRISSGFMDVGAVEYQVPPTVELSFQNSDLQEHDTTCQGEEVPFKFTLKNAPSTEFAEPTLYTMHFDNGVKETMKNYNVTFPTPSEEIPLTGTVSVWVTSINPIATAADTLEMFVSPKPIITVAEILYLTCAGQSTEFTIPVTGNPENYSYALYPPNSLEIDQPPIIDETPEFEIPESEGVESSNTANSNTFETDQIGDYGFEVRDMVGPMKWCYSESTSFEIQQPEELTLQVTTATNQQCSDSTDGNITLDASGGTLPYTYSLRNISAADSITQQNGEFDGLSHGEYQSYIQDNNDCIATLASTIDINEVVVEVVWNTLPARICESDNPINLESYIPTDQEFRASFDETTIGVYQSNFYPDSAGPGIHEIKLITEKCAVEFSQNITVDQMPTIGIADVNGDTYIALGDTICDSKIELQGQTDISVGAWFLHAEGHKVTTTDLTNAEIIITELAYTNPLNDVQNKIIWEVVNHSCTAQSLFTIKSYEAPNPIVLQDDFSTCQDQFSISNDQVSRPFSDFTSSWSINPAAGVSNVADVNTISIYDFTPGMGITVTNTITNRWDPSGVCPTATDDVVITYDADSIPTLSIITATAYCINDNISEATLDVKNQGDNESFQWLITDQETTNGLSKSFNNLDLDGQEQKTFTVTAQMTHNNLCTADNNLTTVTSASVDITVHDINQLTQEPNITEICADANDGVIELTTDDVSTGNTYSLKKLEGDSLSQNNGTFENLSPGTYQAYLTNSQSCITTQPNQITITEIIEEAPEWRLLPSRVCDNSQKTNLANLVPTGQDFEAAFDQSTTGVDQGFFDPALAGPGEYQITLRTKKCSIDSTQTIIVDELPTTSIVGDDQVCGNEVTLTGTTTSAPGQWSIPTTGHTVSIDDSTSPVITVSNLANYTANGLENIVIWQVINESCSTSDTLKIQAFEQPVVSLVDDFSTCKDVITIHNNVTDDTFESTWSINDNTNYPEGESVTINGFDSANELTIVTSVKNKFDTEELCSIATDDLSITYNADSIPELSILALTDYCINNNLDSATFDIKNQGDNANLTWVIDGQTTTNGLSKSFNNLDLGGQAQKTFRVTAQMTHDNLCTADKNLTTVTSASVNITVHDINQLTQEPNITEICADANDGVIELTTDDISTGNTYSLKKLEGDTLFQNNGRFENLSPGTYQAYLTNNQSCITTQPNQITITEIIEEAPEWGLLPTRVCNNSQKTNLANLVPTGQDFEAAFDQSTTGVDQGFFDPALAGPGEYQITLRTKKCSIDSTQTIIVDELPTTSIVGDDQVCGNEVTLTGTTTSAPGQWSIPTTGHTVSIDDSTSPVITVSNLANYTANGLENIVIWQVINESCSTSDTLKIQAFEQPVVSLVDDFSTCKDVITIHNNVTDDTFESTWSINDNTNYPEGESVTINGFDSANELTIVTSVKNKFDTEELCSIATDDLSITYNADSIPELSILALTDYCINNNLDSATFDIKNQGDNANLTWVIDGQTTTNGLSKSFNNLDLGGQAQKTFRVTAQMTHDNLCTADKNLTTVTSAAVEITVHATASVTDKRVINYVVVGDLITLSSSTSTGNDPFYNFSEEVIDESYTGFGTFTQNEDGSITYQSSTTSIALDSIQVNINESKCNTLAGTTYLRVQPTNNTPTLTNTDYDIKVVQGYSAVQNIEDLIEDSEENINWENVTIITQPQSGATTSYDNITKSITIDYSIKLDHIGADQLTISVCDLVEACVSLDLDITVIKDFDVTNTTKEGVQGSVAVVTFDVLTDLLDTDHFNIAVIDGPHYMTDVEAVVDTIARTITVDWGDDPSYVGADSITYIVCSNGNCKQGVLTFKVKSVDLYKEETKEGDLAVDVFNALSPNGDGMNDTFEYDFVLPDYSRAVLVSSLMIFNRAGNIVYNNNSYYKDEDERFTGFDQDSGKKLLDGTYFYLITLRVEGDKNADFKGYLQLKH
jgi:hypothetical protein